MKILPLTGWDEFGDALKQVETCRQVILSKRPGFQHSTLFMFRGVGRHDWGLQTTLERAYPMELSEPINDLGAYYEFAMSAQTAIETFTEKSWPIPTALDFQMEMKSFPVLGTPRLFNSQLPAYRFLIYLRHHGYPSPLLDWTASPYVAAFFAFDGMPVGAEYVSIFAAVRDAIKVTGATDPDIALLGPFVTSHRRHMIQQSIYTICTPKMNIFQLCCHDDAIKRPGALGVDGQAIRIDIPASERPKALKNLDAMNVNPYSLFNTEDSLMRTLSRRASLFKAL